jgi:hypothetical protein
MAIRILLLVSMMCGCRDEPAPVVPTPTADPTQAPAPKPAPPQTTSPNLPPVLDVVTVDQTDEQERPVDMRPALPRLAKKAAASAGFKTDPNGLFAGVETYYALTVNGKPDPKADIALLTWGVQVTVRFEDQNGLGEDIIGTAKDSIPYVREVTPDIAAACSYVLTRALQSAFRDVWMQIQYRQTSQQNALLGLNSRELEERWAALRRLGELGIASSVEPIVRTMETSDEMTTYLAIGALGRIGGPAAFTNVAKIAVQENPTLAMAAINVLTHIDRKKGIALLERIQTSHANKEVRRFAREILAGLTGDQ